MKFSIITILILVGLLSLIVIQVEAISCKHGRAACMASCMAQNCATGYCTSVPDGICRCSRCSQGPVKPW